MSEDYATELAGQVVGAVIAIVGAVIISRGMIKFVDWRLTKLEKK